jgi:photosystem II stability/assembly factor-like uncharacterized protein
MKKSIPLFIMLFATNLLYSQWEWQNPRPTGNPFYDIYFTDDNHGWIVGANGTVLKTVNGGNDWEVIYTETDKDLQEVLFWNENAGLIVCDDGSLLKTLNGGEHWYNISTDCSYVYDLDYHSGHAWLLADSGKVLHSSNFGFSWQTVYDNPDIHLNTISFADADHGWATGYDHSGLYLKGVTIRTIDRGYSWQADTLEPWQTGGDIIFLDESTGYLTTSWRYVFKTENGGDSWDSIHPGGTFSTEMFFLDEDHGWLHCTGEGGPCDQHEYCTQDGGITWIALPWTYGISNTDGNRFYTSPQIGYFINTYSTFKTYDGGNSWIEMEAIKSVTGLGYHKFTDLEMIDDKNGMAVTHFHNGSIKTYKTSDGGVNWEYLNSVSLGKAEEICLVTPQVGFIIGWKDGYTFPPLQHYDSALVFVTIDGGLSWQNVSPDIDKRLYSGFFFSGSEGFISGNYGLIMYTDDAGLSWQQVPGGTQASLRDITFPDRDHGWVCGGNGKILNTADGGKTWNLQSSGIANDLLAIDFYDAQNGCTAGYYGTILYTHDGGNSWDIGYADSDLYYINDVEMEDDGSVIAVGSWSEGGNIILTSHDGGETWQTPYQPCHNNLSCVSIPAPGHIWVAGERSSILHFAGNVPVTADPLDLQISELNIKIFPNPTRGSVNLQFTNYISQRTSLKMYDSQGNEVAILMDKYMGEGQHRIHFDVSNVPTGIYLIRIQTVLETATEKVVIF